MPCDIILSVIIRFCLEKFEEANEILRKRKSKDIFVIVCYALPFEI